MNLIILGLKDKKNGTYFIYDVNNKNNHASIELNETKTINILSPFPFSNFSTLDKFNDDKFEKCYLEVDAELTDSEFRSMKSSGIVYHRFENRKVKLLNEYHDIFKYSLDMLKKFGKSLGTHDLLTWVIHSEPISESEFLAMKEIILEDVRSKVNTKYPLDISLNSFTIKYMDYFRELSDSGYKITFGRYGRNDNQLFLDEKLTFSDETFLYVISNVHLFDYSFLTHPQFTPNFYQEFIKGKEIEEELFSDISSSLILVLKEKGFNIDHLYLDFYSRKLEEINYNFPEYDYDFFEIFTDLAFEPYIQHSSPYDYYCCEDCDGYDIHDMYSDDELSGSDTIIDVRIKHINELIGNWGDFLSSDSIPLFNRVPSEFLDQIPNSKFLDVLRSCKAS